MRDVRWLYHLQGSVVCDVCRSDSNWSRRDGVEVVCCHLHFVLSELTARPLNPFLDSDVASKMVNCDSSKFVFCRGEASLIDWCVRRLTCSMLLVNSLKDVIEGSFELVLGKKDITIHLQRWWTKQRKPSFHELYRRWYKNHLISWYLKLISWSKQWNQCTDSWGQIKYLIPSVKYYLLNQKLSTW